MAERKTGIAPEQRERLKPIIERLQAKATEPNGDGIGCGMCYRILEDLLEDGKLSGSLPDAFGHPTFPRSGQLKHLQAEGILFKETDL